MDMEIGYSTDGVTFIPGGPDTTHNPSDDEGVVRFTTDEEEFTVPKDAHLAIRITSTTDIFELMTGGAWSYITGPGANLGDLDIDSLPDDWEKQYVDQLNLLNLGNDYDGDGQTDEKERYSGTDPADNSSILSINNLTMGEDNVTVNWDSVSGVVYEIMFSDDFVTWESTGEWVTGNDTEKSGQVTKDGKPARYYKLRAKLAD